MTEYQAFIKRLDESGELLRRWLDPDDLDRASEYMNDELADYQGEFEEREWHERRRELEDGAGSI